MVRLSEAEPGTPAVRRVPAEIEELAVFDREGRRRSDQRVVTLAIAFLLEVESRFAESADPGLRHPIDLEGPL